MGSGSPRPGKWVPAWRLLSTTSRSSHHISPETLADDGDQSPSPCTVFTLPSDRATGHLPWLPHVETPLCFILHPEPTAQVVFYSRLFSHLLRVWALPPHGFINSQLPQKHLQFPEAQNCLSSGPFHLKAPSKVSRPHCWNSLFRS